MSQPPDHGHLPPASEGVFSLKDFRFESGQVLPRLDVAYAAYGKLNAAKDNLLLLVPGTGNVRHSALGHVGPGRAYDTDHYCVVCTDSIGGGLSSRPSQGLRGAFPGYRIRDMVRAQHALVREGLGLGETPVAVLAGASMGAFQALEWLVNLPGTVRDAVMLVPGWRSGNVIHLTTSRMFDIIRLDARWKGGNYTEPPVDGLRAAGRHYFPWTVTDAYLEAIPREQAEAEASAAGDWFAHWDAWDLTHRYQASTAHDISASYGRDLHQALRRVDARVLVMPCAQDRLLGVEGARQMAEGIRTAHYAEIDSLKGHLAWRAVAGSPQTRFVTREIRAFLGLAAVDDPATLSQPSEGEG